MSSCLNVLANYAGLLENFALEQSSNVIRPHPIFFTAKNCQGTAFPSMSEEPEYGKLLNNPNSSNLLRSMYIPSGYSVSFVTSNGTFGYKADEPQIISDVSLFLLKSKINAPVGSFEDTTIDEDAAIERINTLPDLKSYRLFPPLDAKGNAETLTAWKVSHCYNSRLSYVGNTVLNSFRPQSIECDAFMKSYCNPLLSNLSCSLSTNDSNSSLAGRQTGRILKEGIADDLKDREAPCACVLEQRCQENIYGDATAAKMPVICTGKNCSLEGYKFQEMVQQPCNLTLCRQIIETDGKNIVNTGTQTLYCGTQSHQLVSNKDEETNEVKSVNIQETAAPASDTTANKPVHVNADQSVPTYLWIIIGFIVLMLIVLVPGIVILSKRQKTKTSTANLNNTSYQPFR